MFKKSDSHSQLDMFSSPTEYFKGPKKNYLKNDSWHNRFRNQIVMRVDESVFSVLYANGNGAPNASIRVLAGMMILKEGEGWSDRQLFYECGYNLLTRSALGLMSLEDAEPVPSTYYLFRRNLVEYARGEHGEDLFKKCQAQITRDQILEFEVSGKQVRMDSKLIGSNIAWYSRYELIHETLRLFIAEREEHIFNKSLPKEMFSLIESIRDEAGNKVVYRSTKAEIDARLIELGKLMYRFIGLFKRYDYGWYGTLKTVFEQQYSVSEDKIVLPLENEKVSAKSIQSSHDTDCHYRDKDGNKVKGYPVNITETCDQAQQGQAPVVNLITDTQVNVVSTPDNSFLQQALEHTQEIIPDKIEKVYADGAYNSEYNQEYCQEGDKEIDLVLTAMQGAEPRYEISLDEQDESNLIVTDKKTGINTVQAQQVKPRKDQTQKKWRIKTEKGEYRYFDEKSLRVSALRQKLKKIPIKETNIRNNVEASIFQF